MLTLSRASLESFLTCQRRFELRYVQRLPWPHLPEPEATAAVMHKGEQFHQLVQRHWLGLPVVDEVLDEGPAEVRQWWDTFLRHAPRLPAGARPLPEMTLSVGVGGHILLGRFDLLVVEPTHLHIYDWKTGRPRPAADLRRDWQTRLYMALAVAGSTAVGLPQLAAEQVRMTYWYAREPEKSVTLRYDTAEHQRTWGEIEQVVAQIEARLAGEARWPLTEDVATCQRCVYGPYCGRASVPALVAQILAEWREWDEAPDPVVVDEPVMEPKFE